MNSPFNPLKVPVLVDLLRERAARQQDQTLYTFLIDGEEEAEHLSYAELDRQARAIAAVLQEAGMKGERVLLLYPPGLQYISAFFGCLYAGCAAVPAYPPRPNQSLVRVQAILRDAQAVAILTIASILATLKQQAGNLPGSERLRWITTDNVAEDYESAWRRPEADGSALAFLQYTSGSTTVPKGVMLSHRNLLDNLELIRQCFGHSSESRGLIWLPPYHDMGLIGGILQPLYAGFPVTLMSPYAFLQRPSRWLQAISRARATTSGGPNFAYELCIRRSSPQDLGQIDLSSWDLAFNGAEPVRQETLDSFIAAFEPYGFRRQAFYPCYGLAEATLIVTGGRKASSPRVCSLSKRALRRNNVLPQSETNGEALKLVGCGQQLAEHEVAIVDPEVLTRCPSDRIGEIWVSGPSIAQGYWNQPEETKKTFHAYLADTGEGPFLRTGDMGFIYGGELFITGRLKDLIIVRGRNYYPQDIELTVEKSHRGLRPGCGASFSIEVCGEERLVIVQEVERRYLRDLNVDEVSEAIRQAVAEHHELRVYAVRLLKPGSIPKTSSGKLQRRACRAALLEERLEVIGEWTQKAAKGETPFAPHAEGQSEQPPGDSLYPSAALIQRRLTLSIAEKLKVDPAEIDIHEHITHYGLDSMAAVNLSVQIEDWLGHKLSPNLLWEYPTIDALARYLSNPPQVAKPSREIKAEDYRFDLFPEYLKLKQLIKAVEVEGGGNPYFLVNDGITNHTTRIDGQECINFSSYNYLGMSGDPVVSEAAKRAIDLYGTSVSASRVASGERPLHGDLEREITELIGTEDALVFIGGHTANVTTISTLIGPGDLVLYDEFSHNSVLQGCILARAHSLPFPHNDWEALDKLLAQQRSHHRRVLIVIEGVYSMDGDIPDLPHFIEVKKRHRALLMIDEAHSIGVLGEHGRGIGEHFGINPADVDLWMGTLSKSFASCGGYIAGSKAVVEYLKYSASGFVYSVGISPPNAASALTAIRLLRSEPERVARLHQRANLFLQLAREHGLETNTSKDSPVIPYIVGDSFATIQLSHTLLKHRINVQPIISPAVENKAARLRFFISSNHTEEQILSTVLILSQEVARILPGRGV